MRKYFIALEQIFAMRAATTANTFIYYIKRLPLLKNLIKDSIYCDGLLKKLIVGVASVFKLLMGFAGKVLAFVILAVMVKGMAAGEAIEAPAADIVAYIFFVAVMLGAPFLSSAVFDMSTDKFILIRYMKMPAKLYVTANMVITYLPRYIGYGIGMAAALLITGENPMRALDFILISVAIRLAVDGIFMLLNKATGKDIANNSVVRLIVFTVLALYSGVAPFTIGIAGVEAATNPIFMLVSLILGGSMVFFMCKFDGYDKLIKNTMDISRIPSVIGKNAAQNAMESSISLEKKDIESDEKAISEKFANRHGYKYLNDLFFYRHRKQLMRPMLIELAALPVVILLAVILIVNMNDASEFGTLIKSMMPMTVFLLYALSLGDKACKAMFYHCDISLLRYGFYRQRGVILKNFTYRLLRVSAYNIAVATAYSITVAGIAIFADSGITWIEIALYIGSSIMLGVLFSVHRLFMYYVLQPYTTEYNIKNPLYNMVDTAVYILCLLSIYIDVGDFTAFALTVLGLTVAYIVVALLLTYKLAPKNFKIK